MPAGGTGAGGTTADARSIPVELRGITSAQLDEAYAEACERCARKCWKFADGPRKGKRITAETLDLYTLVKRVIKPATADQRCSFVELKAAGPQPPVWLVR
jgi:hypothetical protein